MSEKAKALLKEGRQAFYAKKFEEAEKALRQATDLAKAGNHRRLYARALGRLQNVLGFRGRMGEVWDEVRGATLAAMDRNEDGPAVLMLQSLFFLSMHPQHDKLPDLLRDWVTRVRDTHSVMKVNVMRGVFQSNPETRREFLLRLEKS